MKNVLENCFYNPFFIILVFFGSRSLGITLNVISLSEIIPNNVPSSFESQTRRAVSYTHLTLPTTPYV